MLRMCVALIVLISSACHRQVPSHVKAAHEDAVGALSLLGVENGAPGGQKCASCHSITGASTRAWGQRAQQTIQECFAQLDAQTWKAPDQATAVQAINCLRSTPADVNSNFAPSRLGLLSAGAKTTRFEQLFKTAFGAESYQATFATFTQQAGMPPQDSNWSISDADFEKVLTWAVQGMPYLETLFLDVAPSTCQTTISDTLKQHITTMKTSGWQARHRDNNLMMFACSDNEPLNCFNQKKTDGTSRFALAEDTDFGKTWNKDSGNSQIRVLHELGFSTNFWMRTSPDGRFVANGGNTSVTDLQGLLADSGALRIISVQGNFDPSFAPDNSAFMFQGSGAGICPTSVLRDPSFAHIDFTQPGCTQGGSSFAIGLYQSIGASLDGSDFVAVTGQFESDGGGGATFGGGFSSQNKAHFTGFVNDGTGYRNLFYSEVVTPFQGDYAISPSNELLIARLSGMTDNQQSIPLGYKFYNISRQATSATNVQFKIEDIGTACFAGKKGNMSYDERFWVTYAPVQASDFADFGFASASDPEFTKLLGTSENVVLFDLLTGKHYRVTRMGKGQFAQFSHFRADGWIIFMVYDQNTGKHYVVASDAAIRLSHEQ